MEHSGLLSGDRLTRLLLCLPDLGERPLSQVASSRMAVVKSPALSSVPSKGPLLFPGSKSGSGSLLTRSRATDPLGGGQAPMLPAAGRGALQQGLRGCCPTQSWLCTGCALGLGKPHLPPTLAPKV